MNYKSLQTKNQSYDDISSKEKLNITTRFLDKIFAELKENIAPKIGSEFIAGDFKKFFTELKTKTIEEDEDSKQFAKDLERKNGMF